MPFAILDYMGAFLRNGFAHVDNVNCYPRDQSNRMAAPVKVARRQTTPRNSPEPSEPCLLNLRQHTPEPSEIFRNLPELASPEPSGTCLRNLHQHTPELSEIFRNLPELASPEPSGTCLRNLHQHTPELSGTFLRNLLLRPAPAHTGAYLG